MKDIWYNFKIIHRYYSNYIYFEAIVANSGSYDIFFDEYELFSEIFKEIISGKCVLYTQKKYSEDDNKYDIDNYFNKYPIDKGNAIDNLKEYIKLVDPYDNYKYSIKQLS